WISCRPMSQVGNVRFMRARARTTALISDTFSIEWIVCEIGKLQFLFSMRNSTHHAIAKATLSHSRNSKATTPQRSVTHHSNRALANLDDTASARRAQVTK